ncbi:hypothetical protein [Falsigemmobacter faecalis]|nr:hypothetical protein [Falsigemmobacter faecalis]
MSAEPDLLQCLLEEGESRNERLHPAPRWLIGAFLANVTAFGLLAWWLS